MSDQASPQHRAGNDEIDRVADHEIAIPGASQAVDPVPARIDATEVAFPWVWTLVGVLVVVLAVAIALVTESQGIGLR